MDDLQQSDICRVCRSEATPDRPLFHPCICTGSIKFIHQECLVQWLRYSRKEYCELCNYRFSFTPIYSPDMPKRLPIKDIVSGLLTSIITAVRFWFHYTLVAVAWLGIVPLTACRIYRCLFSGSMSAILTLPLDMLSSENLLTDIFHGCFVVMCTLCAFISLVWLREQILHGGGPEWLEQDNPPPEPPVENNNDLNPDAVVDPVPQPQVDLVAQVVNQPVEPVVPQPEPIQDNLPVINENGDGGLLANAEDPNWNPIEWDRAAEELTWERLLGLDGSLVFLEHVFWVVSLNTLFIFIFAFCPYHIGVAITSWLCMKDNVISSHFEGLITTLVGYCIIGLGLVFLHALTSLLNFQRCRRIIGLCYVVVKVSLLSVVEIGIFPLICGWWLDVCSLTVFDATLKDREHSFKQAPGTSMFIHWLVGMIYVFYFASFILLLREVLRPGVLWFLRNLNDPDFNPIQEMIHLPILRHVRRFLASMVIFGTTVLLMLWMPIRIIQYISPTFLPYTIILSSEAQVSELSLELLLLQVILPALLEQGHTRVWLKGAVLGWCKAVAWLLDLRSYLLGDDEETKENATAFNNLLELEDNIPAQAPPPPPPPPPLIAEGLGGLGAAHQALLQREGPVGYQPYKKSRFFAFRIIALVGCMCISLMVGSLVMLTLPVWMGRQVMSLWIHDSKIHELYTAACGLYICWLIARASSILLNWLPQGWAAIGQKMQQWILLNMYLSEAAEIIREIQKVYSINKSLYLYLKMGTKSIVAFIVLVGFIPLLFGLLLELVVVVPLRVPLHQSPLFFVWQDWALGVLYTKIACAVTMMGPNWWFKTAIERAYQDGLRNMSLKFILVSLALPVITCLGLALAFPYILAHSIVPIFIVNSSLQILISRRIYPFFLLVSIVVGILFFQIKQFRKLYEHIRNDKYLVGRRLVNYDHRPRH